MVFAAAWITAEVQVQSSVWCSRLRIWHSHGYGVGHGCDLDSIPGLGISIYYRCSQKKKKKIQEIASKYTILNIAHLMHFNVFNQLYSPLKYVLRSTYKGIYAIKNKKNWSQRMISKTTKIYFLLLHQCLE